MKKKINIFSAYNYLFIYSFFIVIFNLLLINLPLAKVFGFEFSLLNAFFLSFISGVYIIFLFRPGLKNDEKKIFILKSLRISPFFFLLIPLVITLINSFFTISCSLADGFLFYLVLTLPAVIIGFALGIFTLTFFKKIQSLIFILIFLIILSIPLFEFYLNPQVYFFNPLFGYFPGTIYDEALSPSSDLIIYRLINLFFFGTILILLLLVNFKKLFIPKGILFTGIIVTASLFIFLSPYFGFATTVDRIRTELKGTINTDHFTIYYPYELNDEFIKALVLHHEYYYQELEDFFKEEPEEKIQSFIFYNAAQKKKFIGTANADIAKPWLKHTYTIASNYISSLKHEIAHVFAGEFGKTIFKVADKINPANIEGAAMAADPDYNENELHYMAALGYNNNFKIDLENLYDHLGFFTRASSLSYIYAGSFSKYLIDNYGIEKYKTFYGNLNFERVYKKSLKSILDKYYIYLNKPEIVESKDKAYYYFGRKSIFYKICPRYIASRLRTGWDFYNQKRFEDAKIVFQEILNLSDEYSALVGLANCYSEMNEVSAGINLLEKSLNDFKNTAYFYNLEFALADLYTKDSKTKKARTLYKKLISQEPNRTLFYLSNVRLKLIQNNSAAEYLTADNAGKYRILKNMNENNYDYYTFPVLIDLSKSVGEKYSQFLRQFSKTIYVTDYASSYAMYKLSIYMIENLDFDRARKMAALSIRYSGEESINNILQENYKKSLWFFYNGKKLLNNIEVN